MSSCVDNTGVKPKDKNPFVNQSLDMARELGSGNAPRALLGLTSPLPYPAFLCAEHRKRGV